MFAFLLSSFEIIVAFFFDCFNFFAMTIGYGEMPANMTRIFESFFASFVTSSAITFLSFDNLVEKYDSSTLNLKMQLFSLYVASFVLIPARCFVSRVLSLPEKLLVFSRTVVTVLFCLRNFFAFSFFVIHNVLLGNFRIAMFPMISCGIFFI